MSNENNNIPKPVAPQTAEEYTAMIVGPMLALTSIDVSIVEGDEVRSPKEGEIMAAANFQEPIMCLHLWQAVVTALAMKFTCQQVLNHMHAVRSLDFKLRRDMEKQIAIANDNIKFAQEQLSEFGIKL